VRRVVVQDTLLRYIAVAIVCLLAGVLIGFRPFLSRPFPRPGKTPIGIRSFRSRRSMRSSRALTTAA